VTLSSVSGGGSKRCCQGVDVSHAYLRVENCGFMTCTFEVRFLKKELVWVTQCHVVVRGVPKEGMDTVERGVLNDLMSDVVTVVQGKRNKSTWMAREATTF